MVALLRSIGRVLLGVTGGLLLLFGTVCAVLRQPTLGKESIDGLPSADPATLRRHVEHLAGECAPRSTDNPAGLRCTADYIQGAFSDSAVTVDVQTFEARGAAYRNVIGRFGPAGTGLTIVGAHYDSMSLFGAIPGANDNASGVAGLLELARMLGERPPPSEIELVAYANEEPPFFGSPYMGSVVHARSLRSSRREPEAMICLEMIGYFTPDQPWPSLLHRLLYLDRGDFIGIVGRLDDRRLARRLKRAFRGATAVPAYSLSGPRWMPDLDASDHRSYWAEGYMAAMVTDTGSIRNPHYHTPDDTPETLDYERMAGVVDGVMNAVSQRRDG